MALDKLTQVSGKISDKIVHTSDADTSIKFPAADTVTVETGGSERLRITSSGSVGIGTDAPATHLDVRRSTAGTIARFYDTGNNGGSLYNSGPIVGLSRISDGSVSLNGPLFQVGIDKNSSDIFNIDETLFCVSNTGVGIGTDNPNEELHIHASGTSYIRFTDESSGIGATHGSIFGLDHPHLYAWNYEAGDFVVATNATERLRITSDGALGIGGTNYGTAGQVIKSNGISAAPTWQNLHQFMFFGEQNIAQTIATATYTRLVNLYTNDFSIGDSSIASFVESIGRVTIGADGAGYYYLEMHAGIDDVQAADFIQIVIGKNGTSTDVGTRLSTYGRGWTSTSADQIVTASTSCIALLAANDAVQFYVYHNEGTDEPTEPNRCSVMGYKL